MSIAIDSGNASSGAPVGARSAGDRAVFARRAIGGPSLVTFLWRQESHPPAGRDPQLGFKARVLARTIKQKHPHPFPLRRRKTSAPGRRGKGPLDFFLFPPHLPKGEQYYYTLFTDRTRKARDHRFRRLGFPYPAYHGQPLCASSKRTFQVMGTHAA